MSFFDSKQEVINIELTQYGKYLLSKGKFDPVYYAFFDDDVIYDSRYLSLTESQNYTQQRILEETPINKPVYNFSTVELAAAEQQRMIIAEDLQELKKIEDGLKKNINTENATLMPIGTNAYNSEFYPSWKLKTISGSFSQILDSLENFDEKYEGVVFPSLKIPQINVASTTYHLYSRENLQNIRKTENILAAIVVDPNNQKNVYLTSEKSDIINIFDLSEENVDDKKKNFEIEVFIEEDYEKPNGETKKIWNKLFFFKKPTNVKNNILLDEYIYKEVDNTVPNETNVEYYFELLVDEEIDLPDSAKLGIGADIYGTIIGDGDKPFGENC